MVSNYDNNLEKREIQKKLFPLIKKQKMISLAGPNLLSYVSMIPKKVRQVQVFENNSAVMLTQLPQLPKSNRTISYHFTDIIYAQAEKSTFYDLDFCCTVKKAERHIRKFRNCPFSVTLSLRQKGGLEETLRDFFNICEERVITNTPTPYYNLVKTNKNTYLYIVYYDNNPMITIFKFH